MALLKANMVFTELKYTVLLLELTATEEAGPVAAKVHSTAPVLACSATTSALELP